MADEIEALRAEVAALRAEVAESKDQGDGALTRRRLLTGFGALGAAGALGVSAGGPAAAADGDELLLGVANTSEGTTSLTHAPSNVEDPAVHIRSSGGVALFATTAASAEPLVGNIQRSIYAIAGQPTGDFIAANAISAEAVQGFAIEGVNDSTGFPTVAGSNQGPAPGLGAISFGHGPQLLLALEDLAPSGPPNMWADAGAIRFDPAGDLWLCTSVTPEPAWTRLLREDTTHGRVVPITPFRALDTRGTGGRPSGGVVIPGQRQGPIRGGETVTLDLTAHAAIPDSATGVFGSLCVVTPSYTGSCRVMPSGTNSPASAVNFTKGVGALSNAYTSGLGPDGLTLKPSGTTTHTTHLILDVAGYLT